MAHPTDTEGARGFAAFLTQHNVGDAAAAGALNTNEISVYQWRTGRARPKPDFRRAIAIWTSGAVAEAAWLTPQERAESARVVPFKPAAEG